MVFFQALPNDFFFSLSDKIQVSRKSNCQTVKIEKNSLNCRITNRWYNSIDFVNFIKIVQRHCFEFPQKTEEKRKRSDKILHTNFRMLILLF